MDEYLSNNYENLKDLVKALIVPTSHPKYSAAYIHMRVYRYVIQVCEMLGIGWEYNQRIRTAVMGNGVEVHPNNVVAWFDIKANHFRNMRTEYLRGAEAWNKLESEKNQGSLMGEKAIFYDILTYFLYKDDESTTEVLPHVDQAIRKMSARSFYNQCKRITG